MLTKADLPAALVHALRHIFASRLASGGMTLPIIGKLVGYTQVQTTQHFPIWSTIPFGTGWNR